MMGKRIVMKEGPRDGSVVPMPSSSFRLPLQRHSQTWCQKSHGALITTGAGAGTGSRSAAGRSIEQTRVSMVNGQWSMAILPEGDAGKAPTDRSKTFPIRGSIRRPPAEGLCHGERGSRLRRGAEASSWLRRTDESRDLCPDVASWARARNPLSLLEPDVSEGKGRGERGEGRGEGRGEESLFADVSAAPQPHSRRHSVRSKCNRPLRRGRASMQDSRAWPAACVVSVVGRDSGKTWSRCRRRSARKGKCLREEIGGSGGRVFFVAQTFWSKRLGER